MLPAQSHAAGATRPPKRFVFFFSGNGQRPANYYPKEPLPWKVVAPKVREISLVGPDPISTVFGDDFTPLKSKILLIRGLDFIMKKGGGHDGPCTLSGFLRSSAEDTTRWVSIDQVMANSRGVYPTPPPIGQPRSVHVYTRGNQSPGAMVASTAAGVPVPHELDVTKTWDNLWKGFIDPGQMGPEVDLALQKRIVQRSVMDRVRAEYDNLRKHPRLGSEDRKRLDAHMTAATSATSTTSPTARKSCRTSSEPPLAPHHALHPDRPGALRRHHGQLLAPEFRRWGQPARERRRGRDRVQRKRGRLRGREPKQQGRAGFAHGTNEAGRQGRWDRRQRYRGRRERVSQRRRGRYRGRRERASQRRWGRCICGRAIR